MVGRRGWGRSRAATNGAAAVRRRDGWERAEAEVTDAVQNAVDMVRPHYGDGAYGTRHTHGTGIA